MIHTNTITQKLDLLDEFRRREAEDFIEFLLTQERQSARTDNIAEEGIGDYLNNLQTYEDRLAAGEIRW